MSTGTRALESAGRSERGETLRDGEIAIRRASRSASRRSRPRPRLAVTATFLALVLLTTLQASGAGADALTLESCRVDDVGIPLRCGTYGVPEDRTGGGERMLDLRVVVAPSIASRPLPDPLFVLAGGPGQAASEIAAVVLPRLRRVRKQREIVFVDQRGTGSSHPLDCEPEEVGLEEALSLDRFPGELLEGCLAGYDADPRLYSTDVAMDDLDEVRAALGYETVNLYGGSYGTRAALVYMRRHPASVRTAILDGAAPFAMRLPLHMGEDAQRALDLLFADCAADKRCRSAYPDLEERTTTLLARLEEEPVETELEHPRTGERLDVTIDAASFGSGLRAILYDPSRSSLIPLVITKALAGDFAPFAAQLVPFVEGVAGSMSQGMFLSVVCAEDLSRIEAGELAVAAETYVLARIAVEGIRDACGLWPHAELPDSTFERSRSEVPTLVLSGELDPVTPPRWGELVLEDLPNGRHVVAPGAGHNVLGRGCSDRLVAEFIDSADARALDVSCIEKIRRPPFFVSAAGPGS